MKETRNSYSCIYSAFLEPLSKTGENKPALKLFEKILK